MIKYLFVFISLLLAQISAVAQNTFQPKPLTEGKKGVIYNKETTLDMTLHTNGYALGISWGKIQTYYKTRYTYIGIGEIKHPKEYRQNLKLVNALNNRVSRSFVFGKQNNLYAIRAGRGIKRYYSEKAKEKGVSIGMSFEGGFTLGIVKPYYLELNRFSDGSIHPRLEKVRYSDATADEFLNIGSIFGSAGFAEGLDEISIVPGIHARIAALFEWGVYDEFIKSGEVGLMLDLFPRSIPIMVGQPNRPFFLNLYITLQLGKRT